MSLPPHNILIVHPGALGDGLLALPAIRVLQATFPGHRLIWFGHKELGDVLVNAQEVHQSYSFDRLEFLTYRGTNDSHQENSLSIIRRGDRAIGWLDDTEGIWRSWLKAAGIQNCILRSPHDRTLVKNHMVDRYVEILKPWTTQFLCDIEFNRNLTSPLVFNKSYSVRRPYPIKEPLILLHAGSGSRYKCASPLLWASIVKDLMTAQPKWHICLVGGPADNDSLRNVQSLLTQFECNILTGMDLLQIGEYLQHAKLFIGHDSGLSHLAASFGVPSVLMFGPTDPGKWAPRGNHVAVLRKFCHCLGKTAIARCTDMPCLSFSQGEVLANVEDVLSGMKASVACPRFECVDEAFPVPCLG
ncbi:glycosyltransferase family 9 protein [Candidatus Nitrospira neomarina]|uniref:Glycosyltransferase family 9 protein n=1 Tax=Candidatus Nitrospira neomarina TaxID=3020899 RepID=A0AA96GDV7_9BACT|nr:glycosyltransferase family 9 protein [Candidatus Nitrospira neomarina]WNM60339.1 glycosyltransferase family 9 protein [Candidatus Nitrospira neomarina]